MNRVRYFWWGIGFIFLFLCLALLAAQIWFYRYLRSESFRQLASEKTSEVINIDGQYKALKWEGASVFAPEFEAHNRSVEPHLHAEGIRANFNWRSILNGIWRIEDISIQKLSTALKLSAKDNVEEKIVAKTQKLPSWLPNRFEVGSLSVEEFDMTIGDVLSLERVNLHVLPSPDGLKIDAKKGTFRLSNFPTLELNNARLRYQNGIWFLTEMSLKSVDGGSVDISGELKTGDKLSLDIKWNHVPTSLWIPKEWSNYLHGKISGNATITRELNATHELVADGHFKLSDGQLKNLPLLDKIALFTSSPQFKVIPLNEVSGDFSSKEGVTTVKNFVLETLGLLRVEGEFVIDNEKNIKGDFFVGVSSQSLQWLPTTQDKVFTEFRNGYYWTVLHVGGTLNNPTEDLSSRLLVEVSEQATQEIITKGKKVLETAPEKATKAVKEVIQLLSP